MNEYVKSASHSSTTNLCTFHNKQVFHKHTLQLKSVFYKQLDFISSDQRKLIEMKNIFRNFNEYTIKYTTAGFTKKSTHS